MRFASALSVLTAISHQMLIQRKSPGMEPAKNGDVYKMNFADLYIGVDEDPVELSSAAANMQYSEGAEPIEADRNDIEIEEEKVLRRAAEIKAQRTRAAGSSLEAIKRIQTRKFEQAAFKYFNDQAGQIQRTLVGNKKAEGNVWDALDMTREEFAVLTEQQKNDLTMKFVNGLLDWKQEESLLEKILTPLWSETYDKGVENVVSTYRLHAVQQPALTSTARLRGGQRVTRITQTTKDNIGKIIADGLTIGKGKQELTEEIMDEMNTSAARARTIAAQECNTSLLAGNFDMAKRGGFTMKTWHVTNIGKARDTHRLLNGKTVPISEPFVTEKGNKLMCPCDPDCNVPEETVNCHCFMTYS